MRLSSKQTFRVNLAGCSSFDLFVGNLFELVQEPGIDVGHLRDLAHASCPAHSA